MKLIRKFGCIIIWVIYTCFILSLLPIYLIGYPIDWILSKLKTGKTSTWWWNLGDWIEENILPI